MRTLFAFFVLTALAGGAFAAPRGCGCGPRPCTPPPPHYRHHYDCGDWWGRGGRNFWPGFVGGLVGGATVAAIANNSTVVQQPVVVQPTVTQPVVIQQQTVATPVTQVQNVWVDGRYVDQVQPNGTVVRTWVPGHYEQRTVVVQ